MSKELRDHWGELPGWGFRHLEHIPVSLQNHHFNLFVDQTIDDALGKVRSARLRMWAMRDASYPLLEAIANLQGHKSAQARLAMAEDLFYALGQGSLRFQGERSEVRGECLHYGHTWRKLFRRQPNRQRPLDAAAAGYIAAAWALAYNLPLESVAAEESQCVATNAPGCVFTIHENMTDLPVIRGVETAHTSPENVAGLYESEIASMARSLRAFTETHLVDDRGLIQVFEVYLTVHFSNYYNRILFDTLAILHEERPAMVPVFESLWRESSYLLVFYLFGGVLQSEEWQELVMGRQTKPEDVLYACCAIARAFGYGRWSLAEHVPQKRLVLTAPATYESAYLTSVHSISGEPRYGQCYFFQGAAQAMMHLAYHLSWDKDFVRNQALYLKLFRGSLPWKVQETRGIVAGDLHDEVVVEAL